MRPAVRPHPLYELIGPIKIKKQCPDNHAKDLVLPASHSFPSAIARDLFVDNPSLGSVSSGNNNSKNNIGAIATTKNSAKLPPRVPVKGYISTSNVETCALDSGACESVLAPNAFKNTPTVKTRNTGMKYTACGGGKGHKPR